MKCQLPVLSILTIGGLICSGCRPEAVQEVAAPTLYLIPQPKQVRFAAGTYALSEVLVSAPQELGREAEFLVQILRNKTGMPVRRTAYGDRNAHIRLEIRSDISDEEGYQLRVAEDGVLISGQTAAGVFYGIQTFRQLIPQARGSKPVELSLPYMDIQDEPAFPYRGMHLDVSRHFYGPEVVKRYLEVMARYKMNHFHWHLTDDQGWRIPIEAYPKLNTISAWRDGTLVGHHNDQPRKYNGKRHGGYYSKEEIRDILAYAEALHITVIPEIEMPGHSQAILAAYPEFGCTGEPVRVRREWGISEHVLCPKEETFAFLETVLSEVMALFPGKYIHVGGDECPKTQWKQSAFCQDLIRSEGLADETELQSWFMRRIEAFLSQHGRVMIGWDEILEGGLAPNAIVMSWRGTDGGIEAARQGHDVIMTPTSHVYFDYYQSMYPGEPPAIGGFLPLEKVYRFNPVPAELPPGEQKHILGAQGNVWTEYINTALKIDYMAWPRGIALAEVLWTPAEQHDFIDFAQRLEYHLDLLRGDGIYAANHLYDLDYTTEVRDGALYLSFQKVLPSLVVHYSTDGEKTAQPLAGKLRIDSSMTIIARAETRKGISDRVLKVEVMSHLAAGKDVQLSHPPAPQYSQGGAACLVNGIAGSDTRYSDKEWLGFSGTNLVATIDLGEPKVIRSIRTRFYHAPEQWIYAPSDVQVVLTPDSLTFHEPIPLVADGPAVMDEAGVQTRMATLPSAEARYISITARNFGVIPEGRQGAGHPAWLFVDEIVVD